MRINHILIVLSCLAFSSCSKEFSLDSVKKIDMNVVVDNAFRYIAEENAYVIRRGEPLYFSFKGEKVDNIQFYSGEVGHEFRYRLRTVADSTVNLNTKIIVKTGLVNHSEDKAYADSLVFSDNLNSWTEKDVETASWRTISPNGLRNGNYSNADVTITLDIADICSGAEGVFGVVAKSNEAQYNRLRLRQFEVSNVEVRDYSYTLDGVTVTQTVTRSTQIFKAMSPFDDSFRTSNDLTAACWSSFNPIMTEPIGYNFEVPNSQYYVWNVAEMGLKYGESSEIPWVTKNRVGQTIRCSYDTEIAEPVPPIILSDGRTSDTVTEAMTKQPCESWLISRKYNTREVAKDVPSSTIKIKSMNMVWNYSFIYENLGEYTATFSFINQNALDTNSETAEFKIIVVE